MGLKGLRSVTVIGGGLAGLSAACALADAGYQVRLLEKRRYLGGRASSYEHPGTGEVIDNCQHVLLGNCVNLIDLYRRLDVSDAIRWFDRLTFVEPGGRRSILAPSFLPAPFSPRTQSQACCVRTPPRGMLHRGPNGSPWPPRKLDPWRLSPRSPGWSCARIS